MVSSSISAVKINEETSLVEETVILAICAGNVGESRWRIFFIVPDMQVSTDE